MFDHHGISWSSAGLPDDVPPSEIIPLVRTYDDDGVPRHLISDGKGGPDYYVEGLSPEGLPDGLARAWMHEFNVGPHGEDLTPPPYEDPPPPQRPASLRDVLTGRRRLREWW